MSPFFLEPVINALADIASFAALVTDDIASTSPIAASVIVSILIFLPNPVACDITGADVDSTNYFSLYDTFGNQLIPAMWVQAQLLTTGEFRGCALPYDQQDSCHQSCYVTT